MATKPRTKSIRPRKPKGGKSGQKPTFVVTQDVLSEVEQLAGQGLTNEMIHNYYGISHDTWYKNIRYHPELGLALKRGKPKTLKLVTGKLMEKVLEGNLTAIIFYLRTQGRWSEHSTVAVKDESPPTQKALTISVSDPVEAARIYQQIMIGS